ncbi:MAG: uroporphyrinogen-III synthase [Paludibacteraceae bacterium]|jgi:uroporphyrinogen-III synthase|nr:uroporphyrinogen-III synthase [Paludibacteraceae bacterium]MBO5989225.1 uroporphyrinogen-III synthase [Paludibacteraceae bacterium]MEE0997121.1 uroporphyrinogen-III synthase [Paludibacteraceae bacterium]MEE1541815.1 uroporphyrinogen-III synthase [Paludibacteraceae bacterium]
MLKIKKILVSQPKPTTEKSPYFDMAEKHGVTLDFRPFIHVEPILAKDFRQQKVAILDHSAIIFTARTAIDHFFRLCEELRVSVPETMKYFCISESVALYLQKYIQYRKRKIFFGATGKIEDLMVVINKHSDEKYLVSVADVYDVNKSVDDKKDDIVSLLEKNKITYTKAVMYKTVSTDFTQDKNFKYDMLVFFSPSGINSLFKNFPEFDQGEIKIGCFGPTTAKAAKEAGLRVDIEAPTPTAPSMAVAIDQFIKEYNKKK